MGVSITEKLVLVLLVAIPITNTNHEIPHQGECKGRSQASATNIDVVFRFLRSILAVSAYSIAIRVSDFDFALVMEFLGSDESDIGCFVVEQFIVGALLKNGAITHALTQAVLMRANFSSSLACSWTVPMRPCATFTLMVIEKNVGSCELS
jgi:hypothetical protein